MEMPQEVFEDFLVALDTENNGIMQKGNQLAHEFTIGEERTYTKHLAFFFFLDFRSKGEGKGERKGAKIKDVRERS